MTDEFSKYAVKQEEDEFSKYAVNGPSQLESGIRGFANAATFGLAPKISALVNTGLGKISPDNFGNEPYAKRLQDYLKADRDAQEANPKTSLVASAAPNLLQAVATGGGSLARQGAINAGMGAVNAFGNTNATGGDLVKEVATGGAVGGALSVLPAAAFKTVDKVANIASKTRAANSVESLLENKLPGYTEKLEKIVGDTNRNLRKEGTSLNDEAINFIEAMRERGKNALTARDADSLVKDAIESASPTWKQVGKEALTTVKDAGLGAGAGAAVNALTGSNVDPITAMLGGAAFGGYKASSDVIKHAGQRGLTSMATSQWPEKLMQMGSTPVAGVFNQFGTQAAAKQVNESPFGQLLDYVGHARDANNPMVRQAAEEAQMLTEGDESAKQRAAMNLGSTPEGRAVTNSDSPIR